MNEINNIPTQLNRIRIFFNEESIDGAFKKLNIPKSTYSNYYNKKKLPSKLVMLLRDEHFVNPDWLLYGKGTKLLMPTPKEMFKVNEANKSNSHYASSECMMICDAIKRRDPNRKEELVAKILMYINSLDIPLADTKDMTQKKE